MNTREGRNGNWYRKLTVSAYEIYGSLDFIAFAGNLISNFQ